VAWKVIVSESVTAGAVRFRGRDGRNISFSPLRAWSRRGERARCSVPRNRGPNTTLLASMNAEGTGPLLVVEGATTAVVFEAYVEKVLAPSLRCGQFVVMDNLSAHKGEHIRELIEAKSCKRLYLPAYSPDLNLIEEAFSKIKDILRKAEARSREALIEVAGRALDAITSRGTRGFFEHCGYPLLGQLL
jgi:transposase